MVTSKYADKGAWAQQKVQDWLKSTSDNDAQFAYHRMPDAKSARGALAPQPSDWIASTSWGGTPLVVWLEAKETKELKRLPKAKIRQYGKLLMFHLAGMQARVIVYRSALSDWVVFDNTALFSDVSTSSFSFEGLESYPSCNAALERIFR